MNSLRRFALWFSAPIAGLTLLALVSAADALPKAAPVWDLMRARMAAAVPELPIPLPAPDANGKIKHVVIIMQENRSFDDLFQGYPGADTQSYGYDSNGHKINLVPVPLEAPYDIGHDITTYFTACDGSGSPPGTHCKMDGFNNEPVGCGQSCPTNPQYGYVPASESQPYFKIAGQYVVADKMFTSHIDDSFISHQYIIAAQANHAAYFPNSYWGCDGGPSDKILTLNKDRSFGPQITVCWDIDTLGDELDHHHRSWRFYTTSVNGGDGSGIWSSYQAIRHIRYGKDWTTKVINPQSQILTDIPAGKLANVTWVMPTCATSDHAGCGSNQGPAWVTSIINTIGQSKFWNTTAIFVTWDEWGGWYDHVAPPFLDYDGLGIRVPLLIVSAYAKKNYVSHIRYEQGSILRFAEDQFGLPRLSAADRRANSPASDAFNFNQAPRKFTPFQSDLSAQYFIHAAPDTRSPDDE